MFKIGTQMLSWTRLRDVTFLVIALCTIGLGIRAAVLIFEEVPFYGLEVAGLEGTVFAYEVGGPADRAGIRKGDLLKTLDGVPLYSQFSAVAGRRIGDRVELGVLRSGTPREIVIELSELSRRERIFNLERLLIGLVFWVVATLFWLFRPGHAVTASFFAAGQTVGALLFSDVLDPTLLWAVPLSDFAMMLLGPVTFGFFAIFPEPLARPARTALLGASYAGLGIVVVLSLAVPALPDGIGVPLLAPLRSAFVLIMLGASIALLLRRPATYSGTRRRALLVAGMLLGVLPVLLLTMTPYLLTGGAILEYDWTLPFLTLVPIVYAYAIQTGEVGTVDFIVNRGLVYSLLTMVLLTVYALLFLAFDAVHVGERGVGRFLSVVTIGLLTAVLFSPLRTRLQRGADRLFYGNWYDYRTVVRSASESLLGINDLEHLLEQLRNVAETMHFRAGAFLWPIDSSFTLRDSFGVRREVQDKLSVSRSGALARSLSEHGRPIMRRDLQKLLLSVPASAGLGSVGPGSVGSATPGELALFDLEELDVWLPVVSKGVLRGILILRLPANEDALERNDLEILATLANQAAVSCENIALLESLRGRLVEIQRISSELMETQRRMGEAREEERLFLARELHDGPVQDLYVVAHGLESLGESLPGDVLSPDLDAMRTSIRDVAETLRRICFHLRPPLLAELGWEAALGTYIQNYQDEHPEIDIDVTTQPPARALTEDEQLSLFRIVQEALQNVALHAGASSVRIAFRPQSDRIVLIVEDDGCGFTVPERLIKLGGQGHLGLLGMTERAECVGGTLAIRSSPGKGTMLRVELPVAAALVPRPSVDGWYAHETMQLIFRTP